MAKVTNGKGSDKDMFAGARGAQGGFIFPSRKDEPSKWPTTGIEENTIWVYEVWRHDVEPPLPKPEEVSETDRLHWDEAYDKAHTHSNKTVLDGISVTKVNEWDGKVNSTDFNTYAANTANALLAINADIAAAQSTADNAIPLSQKAQANGVATLGSDGKVPATQLPAETQEVTTEERANWNEAYNKAHTHSNKAVLDGITDAKIVEWNSKVSTTDFNTYTSNTANALIGINADIEALESTVNGISLTVTNLQSSKEDAFSKNTAFNKNFGTAAGTVAEGNDSRINNGQTAYGWGDHASEGYITDEEDPTVPAHVKAITEDNIISWNSAVDSASDAVTIATGAADTADAAVGLAADAHNLAVDAMNEAKKITTLPKYGSHEEADDDDELQSGSFYQVTMDRAIYQKP